jgi:MFS family permease
MAGLLWGALNVGLVVFFSFTPPLLVEHGRQLVEAGSLTSLGLWVSILSLPLGGYLTERSGRPDLSIVVFCSAAAIVLCLLAVAPWPAALCLLVGVLIGPPAGAIMALPTRALSSPNRAVGLGMFYTAYYVAMAIGPGLAGLLRDEFRTAGAALVFGGGLFGLCVLLLGGFHMVRQNEAPVAARP